jgi:hypothetical protein
LASPEFVTLPSAVVFGSLALPTINLERIPVMLSHFSRAEPSLWSHGEACPGGKPGHDQVGTATSFAPITDRMFEQNGSGSVFTVAEQLEQHGEEVNEIEIQG